MALETGQNHRSSSPADSGASSSVNPRSRPVDDDQFRKDKSFRRYASGVERALSLINSTLQEWADYISFLGRLSKALQARPATVADVPQKVLVTKRLAQCLSPTLPSGVHQKALEVYAYIFSFLGEDGLARDLPLYLAGLAPAMAYASFSVKPALLSLFESYIQKLQPTALRPALKAILMALLPGLDDESADEFERTMSLLDSFRQGMGIEVSREQLSRGETNGEQFFWQCLFLTAITSPSRRQGVLAYMSRNMPKLTISAGLAMPKSDSEGNGISEEQGSVSRDTAVVEPEPGLLIRCFAAGLRDDQLLIQRGFLDTLVTHLPLHSAVLQERVRSPDLEMLIAAATAVVMRRDMSLNRRLWVWYLGPQPTVEVLSSNLPTVPVSQNATIPGHGVRYDSSTYFKRYGLSPLVQSICSMLKEETMVPIDRARPFRICLSVMDRWEIGEQVIPVLFLPLMDSVWRYELLCNSRDNFKEVLRSASMFFDGVESVLIWRELITAALKALDHDQLGQKAARDRLELVLFVITHFNVREEEMVLLHMPLMASAIIASSSRLLASSLIGLEDQKFGNIQLALKIVDQLIEMTPERAFAPEAVPDSALETSSDKASSFWDGESQTLNISSVLEFYHQRYSERDPFTPPISTQEAGKLMLRDIILTVTQELRSNAKGSRLHIEVSILCALLQKSFHLENSDWSDTVQPLIQAIEDNTICPESTSYTVIAAMVNILEPVSMISCSTLWLSDDRKRAIIPRLVTCLWTHLSPSRPKYNVEAVHYIWRLRSISPDDQIIESTITALMLAPPTFQQRSSVSLESFKRFTTLWTYSIPVTTISNGMISGTRRTSQTLNDRNEVRTLVRPIMLLLDSLDDSKTEIFIFVTGWLQGLNNIHMILKLVIDNIQALRFMSKSSSLSVIDQKVDEILVHDETNLEECVYYIRMISNLVLHSSVNVWPTLINGSTLEIDFDERESRLSQASIYLLQQLLMGPSPAPLIDMGVDVILVEELSLSAKQSDVLLQTSLAGLVLTVLKVRLQLAKVPVPSTYQNATSHDNLRSSSRVSLSLDQTEKEQTTLSLAIPPSGLLGCLKVGFTSHECRPVLGDWVNLLDQCLPFYGMAIFQILIPLVDSLCMNIEYVFNSLRAAFEGHTVGESDALDSTLVFHLNALEHTLARSHDQLAEQEVNSLVITKPSEPTQGFFGNMVSGVFPAEAHRSKTSTANNRLTFLLSLKDAVSRCFDIWSWESFDVSLSQRDSAISPSLNQVSLRLRNRTRRILERLFAAEALECLETLIEIWFMPSLNEKRAHSSASLNLLHNLDETRPRNTVPAIFNAIYSRTNPGALEPMRKSTMTTNLSDLKLAVFLVAYTRSLEDDAMDEIWNDCLTFLKDVLTNPMPHRQILSRLLEFTAILGQKLDNTNFGEQRKMRRDLGETFMRLLTATFTIKPLGFSQNTAQIIRTSKTIQETGQSRQSSDSRDDAGSDEVIQIVALIAPALPTILVDSDRILLAVTTISTQIFAPIFRSKLFPNNVTKPLLDLLLTVSRIPEASKMWKKDVAEAYNDMRFFNGPINLAREGWLPILGHWALIDKDRMPEILNRLSLPTTAGIMFGVGASSARLEADRKTQLNLRRIALLVLAAASDTFVSNLPLIQEKIAELTTTTTASSPSSMIRAEIFMVIRALILKMPTVHLASLWPAINAELQEALSSLFPDKAINIYNTHSIVQACKVLDTMLALAPDDFQVQEWLFITDTIDTVYRPSDWKPFALVDELAEALDAAAGVDNASFAPLEHGQHRGKRTPLLTVDVIKSVKKENLMDRVLRPFLRQLSILAFESTYSMDLLDRQACVEDLMEDVFDDSTLV